MRKMSSLVFLTSLLLLGACGGRQTGDSEGEAMAGDTSGMAQFAGDEAFRAAHETPFDLNFQGRGEMTTFPTSDGKTGSAYTLTAARSSGKYLFVIHEWWGLNDHIKAEAERLYDVLDSSVTVMALDIYDGKVAASPDEAGQFMQAVKEARAEAIIKGALAKAGPDASVGTIGWCFGGGWSLRASILAGDRGKACVMYYGMPVENAKALEPLKAPVLGIFARQDGWINEDVVSKFEALTKATGKSLEVKWYDADHAFANPSNPKFDQQAAAEANQSAWAFLQTRL